MRKRLARWILMLYPRGWRQRYSNEVADLVDELVDEGEMTRSRLALGLVRSALAERVRSLRARRRVTLVTLGVLFLVAAGIALLATNAVHRGPRKASASPTMGTMPFNQAGTINPKQIPDFVATVANGHLVGYIPRADLFPSPGRAFHPPPAPPVFAADLKTLVGHVYPGVGFVALGSAPSSAPCRPETVTEGGSSRPVPCPATTEVLPNVVGMSTPSVAGELSGLGLDPQIVNVRSSSIPAGDVVSTTPGPGAVVHARSVVTIRNPLGPATSGATPDPSAASIVAVPNVVEMTVTQASKVMKSLGLEVRWVQLSASTAQGHVVAREEPSPGSRMPSGALVILSVS